MKKLNNAESPPANENLRKRRNSLIKIGAVMVLAFIVWVFSSIDIPINQMTAETA